MLNRENMLANVPMDGKSIASMVIGSSGNRMVFSWTWYENRKNAIEETAVPRSSTAFERHLKRGTTMGRRATRVTTRLSLASTSILKSCFSLITGRMAHQKLATLSSKRPRLKGKIR